MPGDDQQGTVICCYDIKTEEIEIASEDSDQPVYEIIPKPATLPPRTDSNSTEDIDRLLDELRTTCPICEKRFRGEQQMKTHVRAAHKRPYKCDQCRKSFCTREMLDKHRNTHSADYFFECTICRMKFKGEPGLKYHHIRMHSDMDAKFTCDYCGSRYRIKSDLFNHIRNIHTSNIQLCRFCGKAVKDLISHEARHLKKARKATLTHFCHLCSRRFGTKMKLDNHLLLHEKGFKCTLCGLTCKGPTQLSTHKSLKHMPGVKCTICEKMFTSKSNFYQHVLTHAGIRPYKCDVCAEDFTQRSSLLRHRKNHPGPLPIYVAGVKIADLARSVLEKL